MRRPRQARWRSNPFLEATRNRGVENPELIEGWVTDKKEVLCFGQYACSAPLQAKPLSAKWVLENSIDRIERGPVLENRRDGV